MVIIVKLLAKSQFRRGKMDSCVLCGDYAGEGRQYALPAN